MSALDPGFFDASADSTHSDYRREFEGREEYYETLRCLDEDCENRFEFYRYRQIMKHIIRPTRATIKKK